MQMSLIYAEAGYNARAAARLYQERYPNRRHPDHKIILRAVARGNVIGVGNPAARRGGGRPRNDTLEDEIIGMHIY